MTYMIAFVHIKCYNNNIMIPRTQETSEHRHAGRQRYRRGYLKTAPWKYSVPRGVRCRRESVRPVRQALPGWDRGACGNRRSSDQFGDIIQCGSISWMLPPGAAVPALGGQQRDSEWFWFLFKVRGVVLRNFSNLLIYSSKIKKT